MYTNKTVALMHKGYGSYAGIEYIIAALFMVFLFLPGVMGAEIGTESTGTLTITPTLSSGSPAIATQPVTPEITATIIPANPPRIVLIRTEADGLNSTVFGTAIPGSLNTTITKIQWDWGDNSTLEHHEFPHSHTYDSPGTYTIAVTASQSDGLTVTQQETVAITRPVLPVITIGTNPIPFQSPGPAALPGAPVLTLLEPVIDRMNVTLNGNLNPGSPGVTITSVRVDWDDGNVTTVTDLPATYRYHSAGIFTVNITGTQSDGQSITKGITVDIRSSGNPVPPGPADANPPPDNLPVFFIILGTAVVVVSVAGISQRFIQRRNGEPAIPDIPKAVSLQEEIYYEAKERGDLATAAASAHICARMFRSLAEKSPKMRTIYLELAEKWDDIARSTGTSGTPKHHPPKVSPASDRLPTREELEQICAGTDVTPEVALSVIRIAMEIGREGREGQAVGTSFVVGDTGAVMNNSRQFVLNPFQGHEEAERRIMDAGTRGTIKEFAQLDGAFIVSGNGVVESAGRYITVDMSQVKVPHGLGSRHSSIAGITMVTSSIGIVVSQSGGLITIFRNGKIVHSIGS
ncbi:MAG: diadenylate cyclase [Methanoregulaceae archaeon]|nr:diadenylate cyclase [Methanoregulaceae archaeon]